MTILITDQFHEDSIKYLSEKKINVTKERAKLNIIGLLTRSKTVINTEFLNMYPKLKYIASATSGLNHIDTQACEERNIEIYNPKIVNSISAAEHTWALILALNKKITDNTITLNHKWKTGLVRGNDLYKKTLGIVGLGEVGGRVAKVANAFNMEVIAFDPYKNSEYFIQLGVKKVGQIENVFSQSNIVTLHTPLTSETSGFINSDSFNLMQPNSQFINTSRGQCVKEADLITALQNKTPQLAALDVFSKEPIAQNHPFLKLNNLILTPHIGAFTHDALFKASKMCSEWIAEKLVAL